MQIGAMNHPARDPVTEIHWIGDHGFDFVDLTLEPPAANPDQIDVDPIRAALDRHLPLGSIPRSTTDWPNHIQKLRASGYDGTITLEVFAPERDHLLLSRDLLRKWWEAT